MHEVLWPQQVNPISQSLITDRKEGTVNQSNLSQRCRWFNFTCIDSGQWTLGLLSGYTEKIPNLKLPSCMGFFSAVNSLPLGSSVSLEHAQGYGVTGLFVSFIMTAQVNIFWKASSLRISLTEFLL